MSNNVRINNRVLKNIDGNQITWRHMENDDGSGMYSRNGVRYFAIKLSDEFAEELENEGWPVIWRNEGDDENPDRMKAYLKVFIRYGTPFPVDIYLINRDRMSKTLLEENDLDALHIDKKPIEFIDLEMRAYHWTYMDREGVKAQVVAMNIMLAQSGLDDDYEIVYKSDVND